VTGRDKIFAVLTGKWVREHQYRLIKEVWVFEGARIAVPFADDWHNTKNQWFHSYGNGNWGFDAAGLMQTRHASINDLAITKAERKFHLPQGRRSDNHLGLMTLASSRCWNDPRRG
jgi:nuclear transport factor 2 (NTF2) superfamily protein